MTKVRPRIQLGSAVKVQPIKRLNAGWYEGVVIELVRPGRTPREFVAGGPCTKLVPRYVVQHEGGRVLREEGEIQVVVP